MNKRGRPRKNQDVKHFTVKIKSKYERQLIEDHRKETAHLTDEQRYYDLLKNRHNGRGVRKDREREFTMLEMIAENLESKGAFNESSVIQIIKVIFREGVNATDVAFIEDALLNLRKYRNGK